MMFCHQVSNSSLLFLGAKSLKWLSLPSTWFPNIWQSLRATPSLLDVSQSEWHWIDIFKLFLKLNTIYNQYRYAWVKTWCPWPVFWYTGRGPSWPAILFAKKNIQGHWTGIEPGPKMFIDVILPHVNCRAICHQFSSTKKSSCTTLSRCYLAPPQPRCDHRLARWGWSGAARRCRSPPNTAPTGGWPTSTRSSLRRFLGQNSSDSEKRQTMWILYLWKSLEC